MPLMLDNLPAWEPSYQAKWTRWIFLVVAVVFFFLASVLAIFETSVNSVTVRYDDLDACQFSSGQSQTCTVNLTVTDTLRQPVYFYYRLTNFYQNHRRYVLSRDDSQLAALSTSASSSCSPRETDDENPDLSLLPCGLIASSTFNDSFSLFRASGDSISLDQANIAWPSDVKSRFKNPTQSPNAGQYAPNLAVPGSNFSGDELPGASTFLKDEHFITWMRTAALPTFRKLWARIDQDLTPGTYSLEIVNQFPPPTDGTKSVVLSTLSVFGGTNLFLIVAYYLTSAVSLAASLLFFYRSKRDADLWNAQ